jgi:uncharacterized iron-regulated membrane protein
MNVVVAAAKDRLASARKLWLTLHLWLGLTAGAVLAFIGLTGSLLVFNDTMLRMEVGTNLFDVAGPPPLHPSIDEWIANAHRTFDGLNPIDYILAPGFGHAGEARMGAAAEGGKHLTITVDPSTGLPLGKFIWEDTWTAYLFGLHGALTTSVSWRGFGRHAVGWIGLAMIVSMATGLYLWWPRNRKWRVALTFKRGARGRRRLLDLHNFFSVYLYAPLFILAFTGVDFVRSDWIDPAVSLVSVPRTADPAALAQKSKPGSCEPRTTPGQAVAAAQARFPSQRFAGIFIPTTPAQPYSVQLAPAKNIGFAGQTQVYVERECPIILTAIDGEIRVAAETLQAVMHPLHHDLMLGRPGQVIVFLAGLILPVSFVTGLLLWLDKRKNRRSAL